VVLSGEILRRVADVMIALVESAGAAVIFFGAVWAAARFVVDGLRHRSAAVFTPIRLSLGRCLTLGLEFQLAADILRTAITPSFTQLGQLAAVATIRTVLNHFLRREIDQERRQVDTEAAGPGPPATVGRGTGGDHP
jgi:uncharacterized membrane protein